MTSTLSQSLSMRYPAVWAYGPDSIDIIKEIQNHSIDYKDLKFYLFNVVDGLKYYNPIHDCYDQVLIEVIHPGTGEPIHVPIMELQPAIAHLFTDGYSILTVVNAEQFENEFNDIITFLNLNWRNAFSLDDYSHVPVQIVFTSTTVINPPASVSSIVQTVSRSYPTAEEFQPIIIDYLEKFNVPDQNVPAIAKASVGLTFFEALRLYSSYISKDNNIDIKDLENIKFEKIAARTNLQIVRPKVTLNEVAGSENIKKILNLSKWIIKNPKEAKLKYDIDTPLHRFLLLGLPGTGKSFLCEAAAKELELNMVRTGMSHMVSKFHGETEQNTKAMFEQINALDPICVWADEFGRDASGGASSHVVDGGTTDRAHGIFLTGLQELPSSTYLFAAANDISKLAPEMLRADRFDKIFFVGFPTLSQRYQILSGLLLERKHDVSLTQIAEASVSYTGAEIKSVIASATQMAMANQAIINTDTVIAAMNKEKNRLWLRQRPYVVASYKAAIDTYEWASDAQHAQASAYINGKTPNESFASTRSSEAVTVTGSIV